MADYRDIALAEFAESEARLLAAVAEIRADRDAHQLLAKQLLHALHRATVDRDNYRRKYHDLLNSDRKAAA